VKAPLAENRLTPAERAELIESARRFARMVARFYLGRGLSFDDLEAAAVDGLWKASRHWDPDRGYKFLSYAGRWCHRRVQQAIRKQKRFGFRMIPVGGRVRIVIGKGRNADPDTPALFEQARAGTDHPIEALAGREIWESLLRILTPRLRDVAILRFQENLTLEEVGAALGVSRERIRHQENHLLARLKRAIVRGEVKVE
jgi:RNA polymerase primary sigma factor